MNITEPRQQRTPWRLLRANKEVINNICHLLTVASVTYNSTLFTFAMSGKKKMNIGKWQTTKEVIN